MVMVMVMRWRKLIGSASLPCVKCKERQGGTLGVIKWQVDYCCERFVGWIIGLVGSIVSTWKENGEGFTGFFCGPVELY